MATSAVSDVLARCRAEGRAALIGYLPVGFPTVEGSIAAMVAAVEAGVDIIEVGVPYSDPVMDGPLIQAAAATALAGGARVDDVFTAVRAVSDAGAPSVPMSYWNLVRRRGVDRFAADLAAAGGAGLITPDLIPEEAGEWIAASDAEGLDRVFLVAPSSTEERLAKVTAASRGFVYAASTMGVTGVRLRLHEMDRAFDVARDLALQLRGLYRVSDWSTDNANMFRALKLEKTMMAILLSLIIAMGAFNLVSSQVMLVTDKQADIAILRTLGLTPRGVMQVFMVQGTLIGIVGTVLGVVGGILLTLNLEHILRLIERLLGVQLMPEDVYYITGLPTELNPDDVTIIALVALAMAFLATLYPAWRAARTAPAEALRYE